METIIHLFFQCKELSKIWKYIMDWLMIDHMHGIWNEEIKWMIDMTKNKGAKANILKCVFA